MKIVIDGVEVEAREGETILDVAKRAGIRIPTLCHVPGLFSEATCRICVVELAPRGKLVPACAYPVSEGLQVLTRSKKVLEARRTTLELLLAAHRIRCWSCPRKGGCLLLQLCEELGVEGIPVCAECPLPEEECLLAKGEVCLGPVTMAGCRAACIKEGSPCSGCRGLITRRDVLEEAARYYRRMGVPLSRVLEVLSTFCSNAPGYERIKEVWGELI